MAELTVLTSPLLDGLAGVRHGFFTRLGGVSTGVYDSLNVGLGSRDDPDAVRENRARAARWFGLGEEALLTCYQIHSATVHAAGPGWGRPEGDAVVADSPGLVCGALSADCAPILIADADAGVIGAVHAGWKGALAGVAEAAVAHMAGLGARPERLVAAIGPCIGPESYEVGEDFMAAFVAESSGAAGFFRAGQARDKRMFDLPGYVLGRLARAGVGRAEWVGRDTYAEEDQFYSNRRAVRRGEPDYGRLLSAIVLA